MKLSSDMGLAFEKWQRLTDEYAQALSAMQRGDLSARPRVNCLAREILSLPPSTLDAPIKSAWQHPSPLRKAPRERP